MDHPEEVERVLNASLVSAGISTRIHVAVEFFGSEGEEAGVRFSFVYLTPLRMMSHMSPQITIETDPSNISCINLNNETDPIDETLLRVRAQVNTTQNQLLPNSFKFGYENLPVMPGMRFTDDLPLDISTASLEEEVFSLFNWECNNQPSTQLLEQVSAYYTYENSGQANIDIRTSFCGHTSLRNPQRFWQVNDRNALAIGNSPFFVSRLFDH